jgi:hypothetical protein
VPIFRNSFHCNHLAGFQGAKTIHVCEIFGVFAFGLKLHGVFACCLRAEARRGLSLSVLIVRREGEIIGNVLRTRVKKNAGCALASYRRWKTAAMGDGRREPGKEPGNLCCDEKLQLLQP